MRFSHSNYPVGATWFGKTRHGKEVTIWLADRNVFETWRWSAIYDDGSGNQFDWNTSYRSCVNSAPVIIGKYKRIK